MPALTTALPPLTASDLRQALLADRAHTLTQLYRHAFPAVRQYVLQHGGRDQDAQDVFQDALVVLYEKATAGTLELSAAPGTYLVAVARHLWQREVARRARYPHTGLEAVESEVADEAPATEAAPVSVLTQLEQLGDKCRSILLAFYYFGQPLGQIAATHGYRSVRSATVQKFKCLERLRTAVRTACPTLFAQ